MVKVEGLVVVPVADLEKAAALEVELAKVEA